MKKHTIIDSDVGLDPDDIIALLLALKSESLSVDLIVTNEENKGSRASIAKKILDYTNNEHVKLVKGEDTSSPYFVLEQEPDETISSNYIEEINKVVNKNEKTYYLGIGSLTNLSNYLHAHGASPKMELVQMGGSEVKREHNFNLNYEAAKFVFSQDLKITFNYQRNYE